MIYNTEIEIITSNKDWTSFRYLNFDDKSKEKTSKIKYYLKNDQLVISNSEKLS